MKENKKLIKPEADIIVFLNEDIIVTSGGNPMNQLGEDDPEENP